MTRTCIDCGKGIKPEGRTGKCWSCLYPRGHHDKIVELRAAGKTVGEVSALLGISQQAVFYAQRKVEGTRYPQIRELCGTEAEIAAEEGSRNLLAALDRYWLKRLAA